MSIDVDDKPLHFTSRLLFAITAYVSAALALGRIIGSPGIVVQMSLLLIGWLMIRFGRAHPAGVITSLIGIGILVSSAIPSLANSAEDFLGFRELCAYAGSGLVAIGSWISIRVACHQRRHLRWQIANVAVMLAVLFGWWATVPSLSKAIVAQRQHRDTLHNQDAQAKSIRLVEQVRKNLGRIPSESELADMLDEPLPYFQWDGYTKQIKYCPSGTDTYHLSYMYWDIYYYDSSAPQKGWQVAPF